MNLTLSIVRPVYCGVVIRIVTLPRNIRQESTDSLSMATTITAMPATATTYYCCCCYHTATATATATAVTAAAIATAATLTTATATVAAFLQQQQQHLPSSQPQPQRQQLSLSVSFRFAEWLGMGRILPPPSIADRSNSLLIAGGCHTTRSSSSSINIEPLVCASREAPRR